MNGEADLIGRLSDDLDGDKGGRAWPLAGKAGIGEGFRHERKGTPRQAPNRNGAVAVLDRRPAEDQGQELGRPYQAWLGACGP